MTHLETLFRFGAYFNQKDPSAVTPSSSVWLLCDIGGGATVQLSRVFRSLGNRSVLPLGVFLDYFLVCLMKPNQHSPITSRSVLLRGQLTRHLHKLH